MFCFLGHQHRELEPSVRQMVCDRCKGVIAPIEASHVNTSRELKDGEGQVHVVRIKGTFCQTCREWLRV